MTDVTTQLDEALLAYVRNVSVREPALLAELRAETARLPNGSMQSSPEQGQFLALLVRLMGARRALEIGVFTGYSALWVAEALPADGRLVACDVNATTTDLARRYWARAGVADKIELRLGPALETIAALLADGAAGAFDFAYVDADKHNYAAYVDGCHALLRAGGLIAIDNVLWHGKVLDKSAVDADTVAIRALNAQLRDDERFDISLVPIGDGVTLLRKR